MTTRKEVTPLIQIVFEKLAADVIKMQEKGRVLFIAKDTTLTGAYSVKTYTSPVGITDITGTLKQDVIDIFDGGVKKVILLKTKTTIDDVAEQIKLQKFDWMFTNIADEQSTVSTYAKNNGKKAVVYNVAADNMKVVNITTPAAYLLDGTKVEGANLLPYLTGQIAGCPYTRSIMGKTMDGHFSNTDEPAAYAEGACFLEYDEDIETVRFANSYNSLKTLGTNQTADMKKIAVVEGMDRTETDLRTAFKKSYQGKFKNTRKNQYLFYDACKYGYFKTLQEAGILDDGYENNITTDIDEQRSMWLSAGKTEAADWSDDEVRTNTFGEYILPLLDVKYIDAMESMKMRIRMF